MQALSQCSDSCFFLSPRQTRLDGMRLCICVLFDHCNSNVATFLQRSVFVQMLEGVYARVSDAFVWSFPPSAFCPPFRIGLGHLPHWAGSFESLLAWTGAFYYSELDIGTLTSTEPG